MAHTNDSFEVPLEKLRWRCPPEALAFATTREVAPSATIIGQERALQALNLGLQLKAPGYNIYVVGPSGTGKTTITKALLNEIKNREARPPDICYVHNFQRHHEPKVVYLPAGSGVSLAQALNELIAVLQKTFSTNAGANGASKSSAEHKRSGHRQNLEGLKTSVQNRLRDLKNHYADDRLAAHLDAVQGFLLDQIARLQERESWSPHAAPDFHECRVNVVVDNSQLSGAPVIFETSPTYNNLFGNLGGKQDRDGCWRTDFTQIKAGALAHANGGYLLFNLADALGEPGVWRMLKRALRHCRLEIQTHDPFAPSNTAMWRPEPIALEVKTVVIADLDDYYHLYRHDGDFKEIFKVRADFDSSTTNDAAAHRQYAGFIAKICRDENLLAFDRSAVAAVIEHGVYLAGAQNKISLRFGQIADLLREAHWAAASSNGTVVRADEVQRALHERIYRQGLAEERLLERIRSGRLMVDVEGQKLGQINALMVLNYLDYYFGYPSRLTAAVGMGNSGIVNIEREADLSGKTHNKGVAIIAGYLRGKYAQDKPLSMSASIAFEQSNTSVDGDSASVAEICAILSALSGLPLRQDLAVTGSMNQRGEVQGIGGVNEKIEGFFNTCQAKGLTGAQGVIIPQHNIEDLMLRQEIIAAVTNGKFHIHAITNIDACLELLTGVPAGEKDAEGKYAEDSIHHKVDQRLRELNKEKKENKPAEEKKEEKPEAEKKESAKSASRDK
jgi:lon-related putative ATP-dependent protease